MNEAFDTLTCDPPQGGDDDAEPPGRLLQLDILIKDGDWSAFAPVEDALGAVADAVAIRFDLGPAEVAVALSSDARVQTLNRTYRGKDEPTNVLSFPTGDASTPPGAPRHLGDIVLAAETVAREAAAEGKPPRHHLQHLALHGLLHLIGYDHEDDPQAAAMEALEIEILGRIGVPDPYSVQPPLT